MDIGFDFDSVITDSTGLKAEYARSIYGIDIPPAIFKRDMLVPGILTDEQYTAVQRAVHCGEQHHARMPAVDGALTYLPRLLAEGHKVKVVTSRYGLSERLAREWLARNDIYVPLQGMGKGKSKAPACGGLKLFVDDDLDKLEQLIGVVPNLYLFSWKFNEHVKLPPEIGRVHSWKGIYDHVQRIERSQATRGAGIARACGSHDATSYDDEACYGNPDIERLATR